MSNPGEATVGTTESLMAFGAVDFDWATRLKAIWRDLASDVPDFRAGLRSALGEKLASMQASTVDAAATSPLGWPLVGPGGSGKTHELGMFRRAAVEQHAAFVLVDMTDVRDFWDTLLQGYLDSLQEEYADGRFQHVVLLENFLRRVGKDKDAAKIVRALAHRKSSDLAKDVNQVLKALSRKHPKEARNFADAVRAIVCLNSEDFTIASTGMVWLQGQELDDEERKELGFRSRHQPASEIVEALSWFMSLCGPTVLAFDQLDPIVHQHSQSGETSSDESNSSWQIIQGIGGGLGSLPDMLQNTLCVISCIETTWELLRRSILHTASDRYEEPRRLKQPDRSDLYDRLIAGRLAQAYDQHDFTAPYPTWPFRQEAIANLQSVSFREVLKMCEAHRRRCSEAGQVSELHEFKVNLSEPTTSISTDRFAEFDARFNELAKQADPQTLLDEQHEDERLAPLYQTALKCLVHEREDRMPSNVDASIEQEFSGGKSTKPLHARLRFVFVDENSREQHYCMRVLQKENARAYQSRLKAAMTQAGIDKALRFRHLAIVRANDVPSGAKTQELTEQFEQHGGRFHEPTEEELRTLAALHTLDEENHPDFHPWLRDRQPVSQLDLCAVLVPDFPINGEPDNGEPDNGGPDTGGPDTGGPNTGGPNTGESATAPTPELSASLKAASNLNGNNPTDDKAATSKPDDAAAVHEPPRAEPVARRTSASPDPVPTSVETTPSVGNGTLPFGRRILGLDKLGEVVALPLPLLCKHTMILGGSGSGKSVTVRRLVEEAALEGIPSIVIDCAQDMALFDERWDAPQKHWRDGDAERAERFDQTTEQIVWTPGSLNSGNPLSLRPLPDLTAVKDEPEDLQDAVMMISSGLQSIVAPGNSQKSQHKVGLLHQSLKYFAEHFPQAGLPGYIDLLKNLPAGAALGINREEKLAEEMADSLKVEQAQNPLLSESGSPLDPLLLFGDDRPGQPVRISVISLVKLKGTAQHSFLNQLAMQLFSWIKENPTPPNDRVLRGLLVIDEARDFVPSGKATECKESMMRLAAQARKYRLGLVFATQHPKDIETKIVGNCATHCYGLNNSPASLATLKDLMAQKGGSGADIAKLKTGQFYIHNADAGHSAPIKIQVPMSLSHSPPSPLEEAQIMQKAQRSREAVT